MQEDIIGYKSLAFLHGARSGYYAAIEASLQKQDAKPLPAIFAIFLA